MPHPRPITALLVAALALAACAPSATSPPSGAASRAAPVAVELLLGFRPDVQFAPFYLAQQAGYFEAAGLDVTIEHSNDVLRLVAAGQSELGVADATDVMIGRGSGIPITYVATLYARFPVALIGAPDDVPDDPAALAGLRIGTPGRFGSSWHALLALLEAGGLSAEDVTIREYPQFNQVEGLLNGDVDLITGFRTNEPLQLDARGFEAELLTIDEVAPLPGPGVVVGEALLAEDPALVEAFAQAVVRAQRDIAADPQAGVDAAIAAVPTIGEDPDVARAVLEATVAAWGGSPDAISGTIDLEVWRGGYATLQRLGFVDGSVPLEEMVRAVIADGD